MSIVIPTNGQRREVRYQQVTLVEHCVRSIVETSTYPDYEIVCVVDSSTEPAVLAELHAIAGERLRLVPYDGGVQLLGQDQPRREPQRGRAAAAAQRRHGGGHARLDRAHGRCTRSNRASAPSAARLLWEDGRLQHVGVLFENGGLPGHIYRGFAGNFKGYANNTYVAQNFLAVTGACMMTPAAAFDEVGGFSTALPVNYNDMDYCLKLQSKGLRVVYDPDTVLYHFESSSRSSDVEDWEKEALVDRWLPLTAVDPSTHPHLVHGIPRLRAHFDWASRRLPLTRS